MQTTNKRIKECTICGETFKDNTRPGNKKTCSTECAREAKNERQKREYRKANPPKPNQRDLYYNETTEYPFWTNDKIGDNHAWKLAVPYNTDKVEYIIGARQIYEMHGGRKKGKETIPYNGDEKGRQGVNVRFVEHDMRKPSEVISYKMTREELEKYFKDDNKRKI